MRIVTNEAGGKQSDSPFGFQFLPARSMFAAARVALQGARKYHETVNDRNYLKIPVEEHISHCIQHLYAYLAGDTTDDHIAHAMVRCMFAFDVSESEKEMENDAAENDAGGRDISENDQGTAVQDIGR